MITKTMAISVFVGNMLRAGCRFDPSDGRELLIPPEIAQRAGVLPGYFYIYEPVDGVARVEKFLVDGTREWVQ
jgi:hypothetical protein